MKKGLKIFLIIASAAVVQVTALVCCFTFLPGIIENHYNNATVYIPSREAQTNYHTIPDDIDSDFFEESESFEEETSIPPEVTYSVTWKNYDGTVLEVDSDLFTGDMPCFYGFEPYKPDDTQYSYQFIGWSPEVVPVNGDATYTALFSSTLVNAKIIFDLNGGSTTSSAEPIYRPDIRASYFFFDLTKENYNFRGWSHNEEKIFDFKGNQLANLEIEETMVFKAIYMQDVYLTINKNIDQGGTVVGDGIYDYNSQVDLTATPKPGYSFTGWYMNNIQISNLPTYKFTVGTKDVDLEARFAPNSYNVYIKSLQPKLGTVKFSTSSGYGVEAQKSVLYPNEVTIIANSLTQEYRFLGWFDSSDALVNNSPVYQFTMPHEDLHLFAKWDAPSNMVNVALNNNAAGYVTGVGSYEYTASVSLTAHTSTGYQFDGWWNGSVKVFSGTNYTFDMPDHEVNLEARWSIINYSITYELNGGVLEGTNPSSYTVNDEFTLLSPAKAYYDFDGWYNNSEFLGQKITSIAVGTTGDLHLYAKWNAIDALKDFIFTVDEQNRVTITGLVDKSIDNIVIPSFVHSIDSKAFKNCTASEITLSIPHFFNHSSTGNFISQLFDNSVSKVKHVIIREGCAEIPSYAFDNNVSIETIAIPSTITSIGDYAFRSTTSLTSSVIIPDSVLTIGKEAFSCCGSPSITIGDGLHYINEKAFYGARATSVTFGSGVDSIGFRAFSGSYITSLTLPDNVKEIGKEAFFQCFDLIEADLGQGLLTIDDYAFEACSNLRKLLVPETVTSLGKAFIDGDRRLSTLAMPSLFSRSLDYYLSNHYSNHLYYLTIYHGNIVSGSFTSSSVKVVKLYDTEIIEDGAFTYSHYLSSLTISNSLTKIGEYAFDHCECLSEINFLGTSSEWAQVEVDPTNRENFFYRCADFYLQAEDSSYVSVVTSECSYVVDEDNRVYGLSILDDTITSFNFAAKFPNQTVISLATYAFSSCYDLEGDIILPQGLRTIGVRAFFECHKIEHIVIPNSVVIIGDSAFYDCYGIEEYVIPSSVRYIGSYAFCWCEGTIKCRVSSKPDEWNTYWNVYDPNNPSNKINTTWGYTG